LQLDNDGSLHLCYCTNIHPGDNWAAVNANVRKFAPALRAQLAPSGKFGLGLRLSARDARELLEGDRLDEFRSFLDAEGLYVALINGFPYGPFHKTVVKADVYAPDWREEARVGYTLDLAEITLANFNGANFLKRIDGGAFEVTDESGAPTYGASGKILGSSLEGSNTDIADEFTKLIVTQQAYSANTRVVTTSNQMVQDVLNMLR